MNEALKVARNLIRVGKVNSINSREGTVDVLFEDKDNLISSDLPLLAFEYNIPRVGDQVLCLFLGNGLETGFCLGRFYSDTFKPPVNDENKFVKTFDDGTCIEYNHATRRLKVESNNPIIIEGDLSVHGHINATGNVTGSNLGN